MGRGGSFLKIEQDLPKRKWLCRECEQLLSKSEKGFAEGLYQGLWSERTSINKVCIEAVHRFLVSMAWRTWQWYDELSDEVYQNVVNKERFEEAEKTWRSYLLGERGDVGQFEQHMLLMEGHLDYPTSYYWSRGVSLDVIGCGKSQESIVMVYSKIPKIAVFGVVEPSMSGNWSGTLVEPRGGDVWIGQQPRIPDFISSYMLRQGEKLHEVMGNVPRSVKNKTARMMGALIEHEGEEYLKRDSVQALVADDLMEMPRESIVSDAIRWAASHPDRRAQRMGDLLRRLSADEMRVLHMETNRIGLRCKTLEVEDRFSLLADGSERFRETGIVLLVGVEVFRTRERAEEHSQLPLKFGLDSEEVTLAIGAEILEIPEGFTERGIKYFS